MSILQRVPWRWCETALQVSIANDFSTRKVGRSC